MPEPGSSPATVTTFKEGDRTYERKYVDCGKDNCSYCNTDLGRIPSHGPYWYLCVPKNGVWYRIYLGKELDTKRFVRDNGTIDWPAVKARRRKKLEGKHNTKAIPGQEDAVDKANPGPGAQLRRGPGHVEKLEQELCTAREPD